MSVILSLICCLLSYACKTAAPLVVYASLQARPSQEFASGKPCLHLTCGLCFLGIFSSPCRISPVRLGRMREGSVNLSSFGDCRLPERTYSSLSLFSPLSHIPPTHMCLYAGLHVCMTLAYVISGVLSGHRKACQPAILSAGWLGLGHYARSERLIYLCPSKAGLLGELVSSLEFQSVAATLSNGDLERPKSGLQEQVSSGAAKSGPVARDQRCTACSAVLASTVSSWMQREPHRRGTCLGDC